MREFPVIDSADSADKLKLRLKSDELELYGPSFTPKDVYEAIKRIPRFSDMKVSLYLLDCDRLVVLMV
jgi:ubiquitin carboxyl-terminal hydrolase 10